MRRLGIAAAVCVLSATARAGTAFVGVDVVTENGVLRDQTVRIEGERIVEVGPSDAVAVPPFTVVVDGAGRTLMPGLVDMHAHVPPADTEAARRVLTVMLAQGITTARSMAGHPSHPRLREAVARGELLGPSLILASPPLHDGTAPTPEAARELVRRAHADGFDVVKLHHLENAAVWKAAVDEARALGMPTSGHLTHAVPLQRAVAAGQQIEHLDGFVRALLPEAARGTPFGPFPPPEVLAQLDRSRLPDLAASVAEGHFTPTLALFEKLLDPTPTDRLAARPEMRWISEPAKQAWTAQRERDLPHLAPLAELAALRREVARALMEAGAPLLAGSDAPQVFHVMGFALHEELEALVRAGATPTQALAAATSNPARWLGRPDLGVVAEGARRSRAPGG